MSSAKLYVSTNVVERLSRSGNGTGVSKVHSDDSKAFDTSFVIGDSNTTGRSNSTMPVKQSLSFYNDSLILSQSNIIDHLVPLQITVILLVLIFFIDFDFLLR